MRDDKAVRRNVGLQKIRLLHINIEGSGELAAQAKRELETESQNNLGPKRLRKKAMRIKDVEYFSG